VVGSNYELLTANQLGILPAANPYMRFLKVYLIGYFILLLGGVLALWQSGILRQIPGIWLAIGALIAIGFGIMLAVASGRPAVTTRE
jgi:hypothetical protein